MMTTGKPPVDTLRPVCVLHESMVHHLTCWLSFAGQNLEPVIIKKVSCLKYRRNIQVTVRLKIDFKIVNL